MLEPKPQAMNIGLTDMCNLSCFMCCSGHSKEGLRFGPGNPPNQDMPDFIFDRMLEGLKDIKRISISGNGEPFMAKNIVKKLNQIRAVCPNSEIKITTNGQLLNNETIIQETLSCINALAISIHGLGKKYEDIMINASFKKLTENLKTIKNIRNNYPLFYDLSLIFVVMRKNYQQIPEIIDFAYEYGFNSVVFSELSMINKDFNSESIRFDKALEREARFFINYALHRGIEKGLKVHVDRVLSLGIQPTKREIDNSIACKIPWEEFLVHENGNVLLCCHRNSFLGNLQNNTFSELWLGQEAQNYRNGLLSGNYYKVCNECKMINPTNPNNFKNSVEFKEAQH